MEKIKPYFWSLFGYLVMILLFVGFIYTGFTECEVIFVLVAIGVASFSNAVKIFTQKVRSRDVTGVEIIIGCVAVGLPILIAIGIVAFVFLLIGMV